MTDEPYSETTDQYFVRTEDALDEAGKNPEVVAEVTADQFDTGQRKIFAGLDEALDIIEPHVDTVYSIPEGSSFDGGPVMELHGNYRDFARYETPLLGVLSHASGFATAARRVVEKANAPVLSFGSRHIHPDLAVTLERAAHIAGVDGYSNTAASEALPTEPSGTMPHALMLSLGDRREAWSAFDESAPDDVPRIALVDTFTDEVDEALMAYDELGSDLDGVRLDTTGSRRGDFQHIVDEVRYHLDAEGAEGVDIYVSGGLGEDDVQMNNVDGYGVGGAIASADPMDFSFDIVKVDGESTSKRGKLPGMKDDTRLTAVPEENREWMVGVEDARERCESKRITVES